MGRMGRVCVVVLGDFGCSPRMQYHALSLGRQNPPSVPTLVAVRWASRLQHSAFVIDWHNFGYTLLALSLGRSSPFVASYRRIEKDEKMADGSFCVTKAMQHELAQNWEIKQEERRYRLTSLLNFFVPASLEEKHQLFCRLSKIIDTSLSAEDCASHGNINGAANYEAEDTPFTYLRSNGILCKAKTTGSADLGVCLHTTSSGLDLPMKLWELGSQYRVHGLLTCLDADYRIEELVKVNKNGLLFSSSSELADELLMLFKGFPGNCHVLKSLRDGVHETGASARWATEWEEHAKPSLQEGSFIFVSNI